MRVLRVLLLALLLAFASCADAAWPFKGKAKVAKPVTKLHIGVKKARNANDVFRTRVRSHAPTSS